MKKAGYAALAVSVLLWLAVMIDRLGVLYVAGFIALAFAVRHYSASDK